MPTEEPHIHKPLSTISQADSFLGQNRMPTILVYLPLSCTQWLAAEIGCNQIELHKYEPEGSLARIGIEVQGRSSVPIRVNIFLNPSDIEHRLTIMELTTAPYVVLHGYGLNTAPTYLGCRQIHWRESHHAGAAVMLALSQGSATQWPEAKERYLYEHPTG